MVSTALIACEEQADASLEKFFSHVARIKVGDGMLDGITMGPLISKAQFDIVEGYVRKGNGIRLYRARRQRVSGRESGYARLLLRADGLRPCSAGVSTGP